MTQTPGDPKPYDIDPASEKPAPKPRIDEPGLLSGFDEEADFDKDPELERAITKDRRRVVRPEPAGALPPHEDFVKPGFGTPVHWLAGGAVVLVAALVATGINAPDKVFFRVLLRLYQVLLHTGTGVVACYVAAALLRQIVGRVDLAAARMFAAVACFALVASLNIRLAGHGFVDNSVRIALAGLAYGLVVAGSFRLWRREPLGYVVGVHFALWLVVQLALELSAAVAAPAK